MLGPLWEALGRPFAHGGAPIGYRALNALRLEAGIPWFGADFDERQIPHEAALEKSHISYIKGCYTGQEIVERVRSRGRVNRRLTGLQFAGATAPEAGAALIAGGTEVAPSRAPPFHRRATAPLDSVMFATRTSRRAPRWNAPLLAPKWQPKLSSSLAS